MTDQASPAEADGEDVERLYRQSLTLLTSVRETLAETLAVFVEGDASALRDVTAKQSELEHALRRAFETEQKFHEWKAKHSADAGSAVVNPSCAGSLQA